MHEGQDQHGHRLECDPGIYTIDTKLGTQVYTRPGVSPCTSCISLLHSAPGCDHAGPDLLQLVLVTFSTIKWRTNVSTYIYSISVSGLYVCIAVRFVYMCCVCICVPVERGQFPIQRHTQVKYIV